MVMWKRNVRKVVPIVPQVDEANKAIIGYFVQSDLCLE